MAVPPTLLLLSLPLLLAASGAALGNRPPDHARIFGGINASAHEFPTQVYIASVIKDGPYELSRGTFCGGTILNEKWILTAAHCVKNAVQTVVGFGAAEKNSLDFDSAARVIPHEGYMLYGRNDNNAANDVGLVQVQNPLPLDGKRVAAARLPDAHHPPHFGPGEVVVGWGRWTYDTHMVHPEVSPVLKKLGVHVLQCPHDTPNVICTQTKAGTGICDGDSGGPLLVDGVLLGVASYVDNADEDPTLDPNLHCNEAGSWAVYMAVPAFRDWIRQHTGI